VHAQRLVEIPNTRALPTVAPVNAVQVLTVVCIAHLAPLNSHH